MGHRRHPPGAVPAVAIIGCGRIGSALDEGQPRGSDIVLSHAGAAEALEGVRLTALCDPDPARLAEAGARRGVTALYEDPDALFATEHVDVVAICSPSHLRRAHVEAALDAGARDNVTVAIIEPEATPQAEAARSRAEVMEALFLFTDLPFHQRLRVARICEARVIVPRETLATQGTPGDAMFVIVEGQVAVEHNGVALATLTAGEHFGEITLLDARPRSATVISRMAGSVIVIRRAAFEDFCQREPELGSKLLFQLATTLAGRLRLANERMTEVTRTITL